tara:strand:- start:36 stop:431 length:396 start_codon:yes stop_codon:yes gene_type:complete
MTDRMFEKTWSLLKESNPWKSRYPHRGTPKLNDDIDAAVDNVMDDQNFSPHKKAPQKPNYSKHAITGLGKPKEEPTNTSDDLHPAIQNLLDRARDAPRKDPEKPEERPKGSDTTDLPSQTLQSLHRKVRGE